MAHRTLIMVAAAMLGGAPGLAHAGDALADLIAKVEGLRIAKNFAEAAQLAADSAAREDLADEDRVLFGGLARQNLFEGGQRIEDGLALARRETRLALRLDPFDQPGVRRR